MLLIGAISSVVILLDQTSKILALQYLSASQTIPVLKNIFHLSLVENTGIAFGLFQETPEMLGIFITVCVAVLAAGSYWMRKKPLLDRLAYGFILGGAVGNWIDRIRFNHVVDFLDFRVWPVFNAADSFITAGVLMLVWLSLGQRRKT